MEVESLSAVLKIAVKRLWASIHGDPRVLGAARLHLTDSGLAAAYNLPSAFHVLPFAQACVAATVLQARQLDRNDVRDTTTVTVRPLHAGIHFRSERHIRLRNPLTHEEVSPGELWDPFSGDYQTREPGGWVRLHCNFAHHRNAALQSVGLSESSGATREDVQKACAERDSEDIERAVLELGGAAAKLRSMSEWKSSPAYATLRELRDVVTIRRVGAGQGPAHRWVPPTQVQDGEWRPLAGLRVLDLTRVLAGPVCGRILRALGASVLHVSSPHLPAIPAADVDTSFGKRSTFVDLDTAEGVQKLRELVRDADVVLQSYRPGALQARGFGLEDIVKENPNVVYLSVSAYGSLNDGEADPEIVKWSHRRGFDSLIQLATGIAHEGGRWNEGLTDPNANPTKITPLPSQSLDHGAGWLLALGALRALDRRNEVDGTGAWSVEVSLARTSIFLEELGRVEATRSEQGVVPTHEDLRALDLFESLPAGRLGLDIDAIKFPAVVDGMHVHWPKEGPFVLGKDSAEWA